MLTAFTVFGFSFLAPLFFVVGIHVAKYHVRYLAMNGGEEWYPTVVQDVVKRYREERKHEIESLNYVRDDDD